MDQRIINLYDEYTHKPLTRQVFLKRLALITGSMTMALAIAPTGRQLCQSIHYQ
jgi:carboxymethylenebutenolidase